MIKGYREPFLRTPLSLNILHLYFLYDSKCQVSRLDSKIFFPVCFEVFQYKVYHFFAFMSLGLFVQLPT